MISNWIESQIKIYFLRSSYTVAFGSVWFSVILCTAQVYEFILVRLWTYIVVYISGLQWLNRCTFTDFVCFIWRDWENEISLPKCSWLCEQGSSIWLFAKGEQCELDILNFCVQSAVNVLKWGESFCFYVKDREKVMKERNDQEMELWLVVMKWETTKLWLATRFIEGNFLYIVYSLTLLTKLIVGVVTSFQYNSMTMSTRNTPFYVERISYNVTLDKYFTQKKSNYVSWIEFNKIFRILKNRYYRRSFLNIYNILRHSLLINFLVWGQSTFFCVILPTAVTLDIHAWYTYMYAVLLWFSHCITSNLKIKSFDPFEVWRLAVLEMQKEILWKMGSSSYKSRATGF